MLTVTGDGQVATPERESEQVKVTLALELFQPAELAAGDADALIVGGVLSISIVMDVLAVLPALSVAVPEIVVEPSVVTV